MGIRNILTTCKDMFEKRRYTLDEEGVDAKGWYLHATQTNGDKVWLYIITPKKLNVDIIKYYYNILNEHRVQHAILIHKYPETFSVKKIIAKLDITIELFLHEYLEYNILNHSYVPQHEYIRRATYEEMKKYPVIKTSDPVVQFMGFKDGDLLRIHRTDGTIYLRCVHE